MCGLQRVFAHLRRETSTRRIAALDAAGAPVQPRVEDALFSHKIFAQSVGSS
jgi:hypothetical protein